MSEILVSDLSAAEVPAPATGTTPTKSPPTSAPASVPVASAATTNATGSNAANQPRKPASGTTRYRWLVQVLAGRSLERVTEDQRLFVRRYGESLHGRRLIITQSTRDEMPETFYRLRVAEWTNVRSAITWCERLLAQGHQCFVLRVPRDATSATPLE